ncbi:uncharacterized protein G2W53_000854 [Senna tora]|uniref:Uncharacterized protein n=1 Tax=Senna tora TaxID=362788 RepID=A0A834XGI8_9FABA|nr:uncharacterized protein G2W53_000854 [Senna tora]
MARLRHTHAMSQRGAFSNRGASSFSHPTRVSRDPLEEGFLGALMDSCPPVDLRRVTFRTPVNFSENEDYPTATDGSVIPFPFQFGDGLILCLRGLCLFGEIHTSATSRTYAQFLASNCGTVKTPGDVVGSSGYGGVSPSASIESPSLGGDGMQWGLSRDEVFVDVSRKVVWFAVTGIDSMPL